MSIMTYIRKGLGALFTAALLTPISHPEADAKAQEALDGINSLNDRFQALSDHVATGEAVNEQQAVELAEMAADLDDLAGTLQSQGTLTQVQPVQPTEPPALVEPETGADAGAAQISDQG